MKRIFIASSVAMCLACLVVIAADAPENSKLDNAETLEAARKVVRTLEAFSRLGEARVSGEELYTWSQRLAEAERDAATDVAAKQAAVAAHVERMKALETRVLLLRRAQEASEYEAFAAAYYRAKADEWMTRSPQN
jgi:hypothetical protein